MFHIHYINSTGKEETSVHTSESAEVLAWLQSAVETLKTLPVGAKLVIDYTALEEVEDVYSE